MYGPELILDLKEADVSKFTRDALTEFLDTLCIDVLDVSPQVRYFWDDVGVEPEDCQVNPRTKGTTVIQFLFESNVTIHTLDLTGMVYINIFVCRPFRIDTAILFCKDFFDAKIAKFTVVDRV